MSDVETDHYDRLSTMTAADIVEKASAAAFGRPLIANYLRSQIAEAMIAEALAPDWKWVSADWAGWDFESASGSRLEVKQSAARQTWTADTQTKNKSLFDVAARTGHWVGNKWIKGAGRNADIYIFAYHPVADLTADHRDPNQWTFYVVPEPQLRPPSRMTISLSTVQKLASAVKLVHLLDQVRKVSSIRESF